MLKSPFKSSSDVTKSDKTIRKCDSVEAQKLSAHQKELRDKIESIKDPEKRIKMKQERNNAK